MSNFERSLFLVRGLPGSGKTTLAKILASIGIEEESIPVYQADDYFTDRNGNYNFDGSKLKQAHGQCFAKTKSAMEKGVSKVFVSNTFTTDWEMSGYEKLGKDLNYMVFHLVVENRHGNKSDHDVPEEAIERMKERFTLKLV